MSDPRVTDKVVGVAFAAFTSDKFAHPVQAMRAALEAAAPLLAPQPVVDRAAVTLAIAEAIEEGIAAFGAGQRLGKAVNRGTDAVLALLNGRAS